MALRLWNRLLAAVFTALLAILIMGAAPAQAQFADIVTQNDGPAGPLPVGSAVQYTVTVSNNGPDSALVLEMRDNLPAQVTFNGYGAIPAGWTCPPPAGQVVTCTRGSMPIGETSVFVIDTTLTSGTPGQFVSNQGRTTTTGTFDFTDENDTSTSFQISGGTQADLAVQMTGRNTASVGQNIVYTIDVTNNGPDASSNPVLSDNLAGNTLIFRSLTSPGGWACTTPAAGSTGNVSCPTASLAAGATARFVLTAEVPNTYIPGDVITNIAAIDSNAVGENDANSSNDQAVVGTTVVSPSPDLTITKSHAGNGVRGQQLAYTILVENVGAGSNTGPVTVTDTLPAGLAAASMTGTNWTCDTGTVTCTYNNSLFGQTPAEPITLTVNVLPSAPATVTNTATAATPGDTDPTNDTANDPTTIATVATTTALTAAPNPSGSGEAVTITATVTAAAPSPGAPTGTVTFQDGGTVLGTGTLNGAGVVTFTTAALAAGTHVLTAIYNGDTAHDASTSAPVNQVVTVGPTPPPPPPGNQSLSLSIGFSTAGYYAAGQTFTVLYTVTNTGTTTATAVTITDPKVPGATCPQATLAPGASMICSGPYTVTAADMAAKSITFTATASSGGVVRATATATIQSIAGVVTTTFDTLGQDFTETRAALLGEGVDPLIGGADTSFAVTENDGTPALAFSASLLGGAGDAAGALASGAVKPPFNLWIDGRMALHSDNDSNGLFGLAGVGGDYRVTGALLVGAALYIDYMTDTSALGRTVGTGILAGPYASVALTDRVTLDVSLFYGRSWNDTAATILGIPFAGRFRTDRVLAKAKLEGEWTVDDFIVRPSAMMYLQSETAGGYTVTDAQGNAVPIAGFTTQTAALSAGAVIERPIELDNGLVFTPQFGVRAGITGSGATFSLGSPYGSVSVGFALAGENWKLTNSAEVGLWATGLKALAYKSRLSGQF